MFVIYENVSRTNCYDSYRLTAWHCHGDLEEIYIGKKADLDQVSERFDAYMKRNGM